MTSTDMLEEEADDPATALVADDIGDETKAMWSRSVWGVMGSELAGDDGRRMTA